MCGKCIDRNQRLLMFRLGGAFAHVRFGSFAWEAIRAGQERSPLYLRKRTSCACFDMSALCQKRTYALQQTALSFDYLVRADGHPTFAERDLWKICRDCRINPL